MIIIPKYKGFRILIDIVNLYVYLILNRRLSTIHSRIDENIKD